ncbi:MAG: peroxiredoxin family protein, partial [Fimbriiglobus sp.]
DVRREAEAAYCFAADLAPLLAKAGTTDAREFRARLLKIDRFLEDTPTSTGFRPAIQSIRQRCLAASRGEVPASAGVLPAGLMTPTDIPEPGRVAPDFVAPVVGKLGNLRLAGLRGKPVVLVFFKPGSSTSRPALIMADALHRHFGDRAAVVAVAIGAGPDAIEQQRADMRLTVPVIDGAGIRERYGIDTYPRFLTVDPAGTITWRFDGFGMEAGYLARTEIERLIAGK